MTNSPESQQLDIFNVIIACDKALTAAKPTIETVLDDSTHQV